MARHRAAICEGSIGRTFPPAVIAKVKKQGEGDTDIEDIEIRAVTHFRYCVYMHCSTTNDTGIYIICA